MIANLKELGDYKTLGDYYLYNNDMENSIECFVKAHQWDKVANLAYGPNWDSLVEKHVAMPIGLSFDIQINYLRSKKTEF